MPSTKLSGLQVPEQSIDLALAHVAALTGDPNAVVDIRLLHDSDASAAAVPLRGALRDLWPEVLAWQAKGYGCFFTVNATDGAGRTAHHVVAARAAWVDLDGIDSRQQYEAAAAFDPPPTFAVSTSPDRWHIYWTLPPGASPDRAEALNRRLQVQFNGDRNATDRARVLRLAGTLHLKRPGQPHLVRCESLAGYGQPLTVETLEASLEHVTVIDGSGDRHELGDPALAAPSIQMVAKAMSALDPNDMDRDRWISTLAAFKQALWTHLPPAAVETVLMGWCARYDRDDPGENRKQIASIRATSAGWPSILRMTPHLRAEASFGAVGPAPLLSGASDTRLPVAANTNDERFWATFGADDGARSTSVAALRTLADSGLPIRHDQFADRIVISGPVPWDRVGPFPRQWEDIDTTGCKAVLEMSFLKPSKETTLDAVAFVAKRDAFHPVRDYLDALQWDGVARLDQMAILYMGADDTPFARLATAKFMIQAVARIQEPGCLARAMLILEGEQGIRKSTFANELFGHDWFADDLPDMSTKDAVLQLRGKWGIEIGEMVSATKSEVRAVKRFMASKIDTYRPPYGRATIDAKRHTVFVGTTNDYEYLTDPTGNSRFWPIACTRFNIEALRRDRDQLWAEAVHRYRAGESWWMSEQEEEIAAIEQEARRVPDPWEARVLEFVAIKAKDKQDDTFSVDDALGVVGITLDRRDMLAQKRMGGVLRALNCDHPKINGLKRWRASDRTKQRIEREGIKGTVGTVGGPSDGIDGPPENPQKS